MVSEKTERIFVSEFPKIDDGAFLLLSLILVIVITIVWYFLAKDYTKKSSKKK